jgi:hypothetical protein
LTESLLKKKLYPKVDTLVIQLKITFGEIAPPRSRYLKLSAGSGSSSQKAFNKNQINLAQFLRKNM